MRSYPSIHFVFISMPSFPKLMHTTSLLTILCHPGEGDTILYHPGEGVPSYAILKGAAKDGAPSKDGTHG